MRLWIYAISIQLIFYLLYHYDLTPLVIGNILVAIAITRILLGWITKQSLSVQIYIFIISMILGNTTNNYVDYGTWSVAFGLMGWWMYHYKSVRVLILRSILLIYYAYMLTDLGFGQNLFALISIVAVLLLLGSWIYYGNKTMHISPLLDKIIVRLSSHTLDIYIVSSILLWLISVLP